MDSEQTSAAELRDLYLELLIGSLTHTIYPGIDRIDPPSGTRAMGEAIDDPYGRRLVVDPERAREEGRDWPLYAQTMVGLERLRNVRRCVEAALVEDVPGDLIEAGAWRGGVGILMRAILKAHGVADRRVWLADSFQGLPPPDLERYPADRGGEGHECEPLAVGVDEV